MKKAAQYAHFYLDRMAAVPFGSGVFQDAKHAANRWFDYIDDLIKDARKDLSEREFEMFINTTSKY